MQLKLQCPNPKPTLKPKPSGGMYGQFIYADSATKGDRSRDFNKTTDAAEGRDPPPSLASAEAGECVL